MKVLLVDDHPLFLEGLQNLLRTRAIDVVGTAQDGLEALAKTRQLRPDVVLMDIHMPRCNGLEATRLIKQEMPDIQIVMLTMSADDQHLFEAIKSGATGYLLKSLDADQFFELLLGLARGEAPMTRDLAAKILTEFAQQARQSTSSTTNSAISPNSATSDESPDRISERQIEVLQRIVQGQTNQEIADELFITERTVKYHIREILQKLHLRNRAQIVAYAVRTGMVSAEQKPA
jgi:two-component system NarL family response regulator